MAITIDEFGRKTKNQSERQEQKEDTLESFEAERRQAKQSKKKIWENL